MRADAPDWRAGRAPLFLSLAVGSGWIAVAQESVIMATVLIWIMLAAALVALARAGTGDRWLQREPMGPMRAGSRRRASVSIGLVLAGYGLTSETVAAFAGLVLALGIAAGMQRIRPDSLAYPAAVIWALAGVIAANLAPVNAGVIALAGVGIVYLVAMMLRQLRA
ncbi:MAG: hypothetical protein U5K36_05960 [Roseovarius sp.]|nr:hypothetical protein [Roseovarius sp.]